MSDIEYQMEMLTYWTSRTEPNIRYYNLPVSDAITIFPLLLRQTMTIQQDVLGDCPLRVNELACNILPVPYFLICIFVWYNQGIIWNLILRRP